jgi:hypothetical protein
MQPAMGEPTTPFAAEIGPPNYPGARVCATVLTHEKVL